MKLKLFTASLLVFGFLGVNLTDVVAAPKKDNQAKLEAKAKISKAEATKIALAKVPNGTIKEGELEKEKGKLIWSFDISTPNTEDITEVHVDAVTGKIVRVEKETPAAQKKEKEEKQKTTN
ncbi:MAG: PepSY domain-containing protein [Verrucomicrobiota bacterium]